MILNLLLADPINIQEYSSLPIKENVYKTYKVGDNTVYLLRNPRIYSEENPISIMYSFMLYNKENDLVFVLSVERINLREMSFMLGVPYRELQEEYNTKGQFAEPRIILYSSDSKEDYGAYTESLKEEFFFPFLWDIILDAIDSPDDPVEI